MSNEIKKLKDKLLIQGIGDEYSSQQLFCSLTEVDDLLIFGGRGGGKTEALLSDIILRFVRGKEQGINLNFCFLRNVYGALNDSVSKLRNICSKFFNEDEYKFYKSSGYDVFVMIQDKNRKYSNFDDIKGSRLFFRAAKSVKDYEEKFHGSNFDGIYIDELSTVCPKLVKMLKDTLRSSKGVIPVFRAATNPWGFYTKEVYEEYLRDKVYGKMYEIETEIDSINYLTGEIEKEKIVLSKGVIKSFLDENYHLPKNYKMQLIKNYINDEKKLKSYVLGDFDFTESRFLNIDIGTQVIEPFILPSSWARDCYMSYDDGTTSPFSVLWLVEAKTGSYKDARGRIVNVPVGSIFVINEYYGSEVYIRQQKDPENFSLTPDDDEKLKVGLNITHSEIAREIKRINLTKVNSLLNGYTAKCGPADTSITKNDRGKNGKTVYDIFASEGLKWSKAFKGNHSRVNNANYIKNMITATINKDMTQPHLYFFDNYTNILVYNLLSLKSNPNNPDDILDDNRDHDYDALRYGITYRRRGGIKLIDNFRNVNN